MAGKIKLKKIKRILAQKKKNLKKYEDQEKKARVKWNKSYKAFLDGATELANLTRYKTKKKEKLRKKILEWEKVSPELTALRDKAREKIAQLKGEIAQYEIEQAMIFEQVKSLSAETNEIVAQVFELNDTAVKALEVRNDYLNRHVFRKLVNEQGKLRSQITFDNQEGTRRVVAMVNTISLVKPELAEQALAEIEGFFRRLQPQAELREETKTLFELTKKLLIEKTKFKVGPDLYRFLSLELNAKLFPELKKAQHLLQGSLRSEKTNSYVRLYTRPSPSEKWEPVSQS